MIIEEYLLINPKAGLAVVAVIMTLVSTLVQKKFTDQQHLKHLKARQKELQKELKKEKDENILKELNAEFMGLTVTMMKSSFKPIFITFIPFILIFTWLRGIYTPILSSWLWYYIGFSVLSSIILRKILKVE